MGNGLKKRWFENVPDEKKRWFGRKEVKHRSVLDESWFKVDVF